MKEQGYITEEEYTIAMNDNVYDRIAMHTQSQAESAPYSYFIDEVITNLINDLMVQKGYTEVQAKNVVYSGGLKIYTTQDSYMQSILDTEFQNPENFPANTQIGLDWALTGRAGRRRGTELQQRDAAALLPQQRSEFRSAL